MHAIPVALTPSRVAELADNLLQHAQKTCTGPPEAAAVFALCLVAMVKDRATAFELIRIAYADLRVMQDNC